MLKPSKCILPNCSSDRYSNKDLCRIHYRRWQVHGDPTAGQAPRGSALAFIHEHVGHGGDECLLWAFAVDKKGYGVLKYGPKRELAHRVMCRLAHGEPPDASFHAAHSCRRRSCVNPNHLRWATARENNLDKVAHGTANRVVSVILKTSKLSVEDVQSIRARRPAESLSKLSAEFGVTRSMIVAVAKRKSWRQVT